jgi:DNA-binding SARP family transcriptional activator
VLRIEVLGPTRVTSASQTREIPGARTRTLLHRLVVASGNPVDAAELMDCIWGKPVNPQALRTLVSRCRSALESSPNTITSGPVGYKLDSGDLQVDIAEFTSFASQPQDPEMSHKALAMWRGRPFHENADEIWALPTVRRLELTRVELLRHLAAGNLDAGNWAEVAHFAFLLSEMDPYDENAILLTALSLVGTGHRVEALRVLATFRTVLREDLGLDPGAELAACELRLLRSEPTGEQLVERENFSLPTSVEVMALMSQRAASARVGPQFARGSFWGRVAFLDDLVSRVEARLNLAAGSGVLLTGLPGIGKTRLCRELLSHAEQLGYQTAYANFKQQPMGLFSVLRDITAQLDARWTLTLEGLANKSADHRYDIAVSLSEQWRQSSGTKKTVVVLDDLQWADEDSLVIVGTLLSLTADLSISFVCTHRTPISRVFVYPPTLDDCIRSGWLDEVNLGPLDDSEGKQLIREASPELQTELVQRVGEVAEGNPFLLLELARNLSSTRTLNIPRSIASLYQPLLDVIGERGAAILELASLIGRDVEMLLLERVCGHFSISASEVQTTTDWAVRNGLFSENLANPQVVSFSHEIVKEFLAGVSSALLRALRHQVIAEQLLQLPALATQHERIAHHYVAAGSGSVSEAAEHLLVSARDALEAGSYHRAESAAATVRLLVDDPSDARSLHASTVEARATMALGSVASAQQTLFAVSHAALSRGHHDVVIDAAMVVGGPWLAQRANPQVCSLQVLGLTLIADQDQWWQLRMAWARQHWNEPNSIEEARNAAEEALCFRGSNAVRSEALAAMISLHRGPNTTDRRREWSEELRELLGDGAFHRLANFAAMHRLVVAAEMADHAGIDWGLARLNRLARATSRPVTQWIADYSAASVLIWRGEYDTGSHRSRTARSVGHVSGLGDVDVIYALQNLERRRRTGRLSESLAQLQGSATTPVDPLWDSYAALAFAETGDERAYPLLDGLMTRVPSSADYVRHSALTIARLAAQRANHHEAEVLFATHLEPYGSATAVTADLTTIIASPTQNGKP